MPSCSTPRIGDRVVRRPEDARRARAHLRAAGSAPAKRRPRGAGRAQRRHLAGRDAQRSVAVAADARASSASIRPSAASACRRTISRKAWARREVILARAAKVAGAPTVASRFVQRIAALAGGALGGRARARRPLSGAGARARCAGRGRSPPTRPAPKPPRAARPDKLSVTAIEDWLRDPYTIYAKYILRLRRSTPVDTPPGARDRGTVIHGAIGDYTKMFADKPPADPLQGAAQARREAFRAARRLSGSARLLVAALRAHRALVRGLGPGAARTASPRCMPKSAAS